MGDRFTVSLDEDNAEWVEQQREDRDRSKAWVVNEAIRAARDAESVYLVSTGEHHTGEVSPTPVNTDVLDDLEQRLADAEARLSALEGREHSPPERGDSRAAGDDESPTPTPDAHSAAHSASQETPDSSEPAREQQGRAGVAVNADSDRAAAEEAVAEASVPGRSPGVERVRREALLWAWDYLREHEHCTSSQIANATLGAFWDEKRLNYSVSPRYPGYGMWDAYLRDALAELPRVEAPGRRGKDWFFDD